ncbi:hypothetical protein Tco_1530166 [Tanacetum coccineum]
MKKRGKCGKEASESTFPSILCMDNSAEINVLKKSRLSLVSMALETWGGIDPEQYESLLVQVQDVKTLFLCQMLEGNGSLENWG